MRNLLALMAFAVLVFAGVGWYRDWYEVTTKAADAGRHSVQIDFDRSKIMADVEKGIQKLEEKKQEYTAGTAWAEQTPTTVGPPKPETGQAAATAKRDAP